MVIFPAFFPQTDAIYTTQFYAIFCIVNPTAPSKAKIVYNFGLSECSRVKFVYFHWNKSTKTAVCIYESRKENPQKLTQLRSRSHPRHLVGKRTAQKDITIDTTSDSQVNLVYLHVIKFHIY